MHRTVLAAIAVVLAVTGCGSTVSTPAQSTLVGGTGLGGQPGNGLEPGVGLAGPISPDGSELAAGPDAGRPAAPGPTGDASLTGGADGSAAGPGGSSGSPGGASSGGAPSTKPVQVGIMLASDVGKFAAAFGADAGNAGSQEQIARRAVDHVNRKGGLAGRKIELVVFDVSLTSSETYAQQQQRMCTYFGEDHDVVAVLTVGSSLDNTFPQCLAKYGIINVAGGTYLHDDNDFRNVRNLVAPVEASVARLGKAMVQELTGRGLLKSGDKLGMLTEDAPAGLRTTNGVIIPLLKAKGIEVINYVIEGPTSTADISNSAAAIQSAQLRMAAEGVENVAFMCKGCHGLFVQYAESQSYYPRYFLHSIDGIRGAGGKGKRQSYDGAVALGWTPVADVGRAVAEKELAVNADAKQCREIMKEFVSDDTSYFITQTLCGGFLDLAAAANALGGAPVTGANLMKGFDTFGTTRTTAVSFRTEINPSKHYGAVGYRRMTYDSSRDAFVYEDSVLRPFPS